MPCTHGTLTGKLTRPGSHVTAVANLFREVGRIVERCLARFPVIDDDGHLEGGVLQFLQGTCGVVIYNLAGREVKVRILCLGLVDGLPEFYGCIIKRESLLVLGYFLLAASNVVGIHGDQSPRTVERSVCHCSRVVEVNHRC